MADQTIPTTLVAGGTPYEGTSDKASKRDHRHGGSGLFVNPMTLIGDIIVATDTPTQGTPKRLAANQPFQVLRMDSGPNYPEWAGGLSLIADTTLGVDTASITFSAIPGTLRHLVLFVSARGDGAVTQDLLLVQFNGDTAANYDRQSFYGNNATPNAANGLAAASIAAGFIPGASVTRASLSSGNVLFIPNYSQPTFEKVLIGIGGMVDSTAANGYAANQTQAWRSTATINSIKLFANTSAKFKAGTAVSLYGVTV